MSDMKKLTRKVSFRVSEEMGEWMDVAGADAVREAIQAKMEPVEARVTQDWSKDEDKDEDKEQFLADRPRTSFVDQVVERADVPAWKVKLEQQLAKREAREASSVLSGSAAPAAVASVSAPRSVVFQQSEAERARRMALARSAATGMKMQPQMVKPVDPYVQGDPEPPEE